LVAKQQMLVAGSC